MMLSLLAIGLGAVLGAWARWGLGLWLNSISSQVPLGTLAANLIGGYGIGLAIGWFAMFPAVSPQWRLFIITGLLGGLTTFSTFSAEVMQLLGRQQLAAALATLASHVLGSLAMTALGLLTMQALRQCIGGVAAP